MARGPDEEQVRLEAHEQRQLELIERHLKNVDSSVAHEATDIRPSPVRLAMTIVWGGAVLIGLAADSVFLVLLAVAAAVLFGLDIPALNDGARFELLVERSELARRRLALFAAWCLAVLVGLSMGSVVTVLLALAAAVTYGLHLYRQQHEARR